VRFAEDYPVGGHSKGRKERLGREAGGWKNKAMSTMASILADIVNQD
jgi:hypothetical protein